MSMENVQKFIERVDSDEALRRQIEEQMASVEAPDAIAEQLAAFGEKVGLPFTAEEYQRECQKIPEEELDNVAGGTATEDLEIKQHADQIKALMKKAGEGWWSLNRPQGIDSALGKLGIDADSSAGFLTLGPGSKNNTYRDKETGQMILHSEVMEFLKTGKKPWRQ